MSAPIVGIGELLWDLLPSGRRAGGAPFNFVFHCNQLGHSAIMVSRVGDDDLGRELRETVRSLGMSDQFIQTDPEHATGTVEVRVDPLGSPQYRIVEKVAWDFVEWNDELQTLARSARAVCFGTLAQREMTSRRTIQHFLANAVHDSLIIFDINFRPPHFDIGSIAGSFPWSHWLKLNDQEWDHLQRWVPATGLESLSAFRRQYQLDRVFLTRGERGAVAITHKATVEVAGRSCKVVDTVGAGDAFTAALVTQHFEGRSLSEALRFANTYAAAVTEQTGGTPKIDRREVERRC